MRSASRRGGGGVDRPNVYWRRWRHAGEAVETLPTIPDGKRRIALCRILQTPVVDGDALCASIAAASIVAKMLRDSLMTQHAQLHPGYGCERHKGYATHHHIDALGLLGLLSLIGFHSSLGGKRLTPNTSWTSE